MIANNRMHAGSTPGVRDGSLAALLRSFYLMQQQERTVVLGRFRDTPDAMVYPELECALRNNEDANLRNAAMELYAALSGRSVPVLLALLTDADEEIRTFAAVVLGTMRHPDAVPPLIRSLGDTALNVKHAAAEALGRIRDRRAVGPLVAALQGDLWLQFPAAIALGDIGDRSAVGPLLAALDIPGVNVPAIQSLGKIADPSSLGRLSVYLEDEEPSLREWALEAVAKILAANPDMEIRAVVSALTEELLIATLCSDSIKARRNALRVLGRMGSPQSTPVLGGLIADRELGEDAIDALVRLGGEPSAVVLESLSRDPSMPVRRAALRALVCLGTARAANIVLPMLSDAAEEVRREAKTALSRFTSPDAHSAIHRLLADPDSPHRANRDLRNACASCTGSSPAAFDAAEMAPLRDFISQSLGLHFDDDRLNVLYHRLSPLAAARGVRSFRDFLRHLEDDTAGAETLHDVAANLTNNETYFFRERDQLHALVRDLLPGLIADKPAGPGKKIRILSAGCSSGEEAYTIAMLLAEAGIRATACETEILGIDIDRDALETARTAKFTPRSFRKGDDELVDRYFVREAGDYCAKPELRRGVSFRHGNLLTASDCGRFDAIVCRNALIYFSDATLRRAVDNFHRLLAPGGYLLLGHSESLCRIETEFVPVRLEGAVIYRKPAADVRAGAGSMP